MAANEFRKVSIWDIWIRLFHWSLAGAVIFQLINGQTGWQFYDWHRTAGELVLLLLAFRLTWGIIGSSNARLTVLTASPEKALNHLRQLWHRQLPAERGHNAAGGWAIIAMLVLLTTQAVTGLFIADEDEFIEGALYGTLGSDTELWLYRVHKTNASILQALAVLHVAMVFIYLLYARTNLIKPMIVGYLKWPTGQPIPEVKWRPVWLGVIALLLCTLFVSWLVGWF